MMPAVDIALRVRRAAFNRALAEGDLDAIHPILAPDVVLVTGTDSAVISGRKAQLMQWRREFAAAPRTVYTRTPETIVASPVEPIAFEHGHWEGVLAGRAQPLAAGCYTAKWRQRDGDWVIEAELYLTLSAGSGEQPDA
jgi:ketosteroid isomerase-like protein